MYLPSTGHLNWVLKGQGGLVFHQQAVSEIKRELILSWVPSLGCEQEASVPRTSGSNLCHVCVMARSKLLAQKPTDIKLPFFTHSII